MRLLVTRRMTAEAEARIAEAFDAHFRDDTRPMDSGACAAALREYDAIMPTLGDAFDAAAFHGGGLRTRILANFGAGYNHIDIAAARNAGVIVTNTPDVVTESTADLALTLILMTARRAGEGERLVRAGAWTGWHPTQMLGIDVTGLTLGVVGMGRIGQAIARRCHFGFGMPVIFHNRSALNGLDFPAQQVALNDLLTGADVVVLAVPGGAGTRHLIGGNELALLRERAILVNVARGDVVDETALIAALESGRISAGLDVYEREPAVPPALRKLDNVVLLPHLGTAAEGVRTQMALRALDNLRRVMGGSAPRDPVN